MILVAQQKKRPVKDKRPPKGREGLGEEKKHRENSKKLFSGLLYRYYSLQQFY